MNVAFAGGMYVEGPYCANGKANQWRRGWGRRRYAVYAVKCACDISGRSSNLVGGGVG